MKDQTTSRNNDHGESGAANASSKLAKIQPGEPTTSMERLVAKCWEDELKMTGIGLEDNFFSLGGDSRRALQMIFRVQELLPPLLPLGPLFFQDPTIKGFAAQLAELLQMDEKQ